MTPVKLLFAALIVALIPSTSTAKETQQQLSEALFIATHLGHMPSVVDLVKRGANVNYLNEERETPMHAAAARGYLHIIQYLKNHRGRLHPRTVKNWIPLHHAVRFGHHQVANYLLANGAPLNLRTRSGQTVFDLAKGTNNAQMLVLLQRYQR